MYNNQSAKPRMTSWHSEMTFRPRPAQPREKRDFSTRDDVLQARKRTNTVRHSDSYSSNNHKNGNGYSKPNNVKAGPTTLNIPPVRGKLRVIPLGGLGEVGKNMTALEFNDTIVIIDAGTMFPDSYMFGIDHLIPNSLYVEERKDKVKAIICTHGHEDHIGALPYIVKKLPVPIYAAPFAKGLIALKLEEHGFKNIPLHSIKDGDVLKFGDIRVEPFAVTHSIPDALGFSIRIPGQTPDAKPSHIVWSGDWKWDATPVAGKAIDKAMLAKWGEEGVDVLFADSTNSERPGSTVSESEIGQSFVDIFSKASGRVILATFASQIHRVHQVIRAAVKTNRKIAFSGRSMVRNAELAIEMGYIDAPKESIIPLEKAKSIPPDKLLIISTGSQGEEMSSLFRMAQGSHRQFRIKAGDTVVLSASPIPGNEAAIGDVINNLFRLGAKVVYGKEIDVHVSGHAYRDELAMLINILKPKHFVPIHGEYRHLSIHAELARQNGVESTIIMENGEILEVTEGKAEKSAWRVPAEGVLVDGLGVGDVGNIVLRDRQAMASDGIFVCIVTVDRRTREIVTSPDIISRGFVYMRAAEELIRDARSEVRRVFLAETNRTQGDWAQVKNALREKMNKFLEKRTERRPIVIPVIIEV
ncbi:ribonuclease J [Patescibacteria group bacterium]|nr:ribonuclease J [Patescibacteria group bacterium]